MSGLELEAFRYHNISSNSQVLGTNFNGTIQFDLRLNSDAEVRHLGDSYFVLGATFNHPTDAFDANYLVTSHTDAVATTNQGFAQNVDALLFTSAEFRVNDLVVTHAESFPTHVIHNRLMNETYEMQLNSSCPMLPYDTSYAIATNFTDAQADNLVPGAAVPVNMVYQKQDIINNNIIRRHSSAAGTLTVWDSTLPVVGAPFQVNIVIPFPFGETVSPDAPFAFMGNTKLSIVFQVNQSWNTSIFNSVPAGGAMPINRADFHTFEWCVPIHKGSVPRSLTSSNTFLETYSVRANNNSNQYQYQIPATTQRVVISFMQTVGNANVINGPAFTNTTPALRNGIAATGVLNSYIPVPLVGTTAPYALRLTDMYININGANFPQNPYHFADGSRDDWSRAYSDYLRFSGSHESGETNIIRTFKEYLQCPVFVFNTKSPPNSVGQTTLTIYCNGAAVSPSTTELCLTCSYPKLLEIEYDDGGVPKFTSVKNVA